VFIDEQVSTPGPTETTGSSEPTAEFDPLDRLLLRRLRLTEIEALMVCNALRFVKLGPEFAKLLWSDVKNALDSQPSEFQSRIDEDRLLARLQRLNDGEAVALLRAVEWFWERPSLPIATRLQCIGLS
jgi:hypothetical protein